MFQSPWNFVCQFNSMSILCIQKGILIPLLFSILLLLSELCLSLLCFKKLSDWSGCKTVNSVRAIVFHWKLMPSLATLALGINFQGTLALPWVNYYLIIASIFWHGIINPYEKIWCLFWKITFSHYSRHYLSLDLKIRKREPSVFLYQNYYSGDEASRIWHCFLINLFYVS